MFAERIEYRRRGQNDRLAFAAIAHTSSDVRRIATAATVSAANVNDRLIVDRYFRAVGARDFRVSTRVARACVRLVVVFDIALWPLVLWRLLLITTIAACNVNIVIVR